MTICSEVLSLNATFWQSLVDVYAFLAWYSSYFGAAHPQALGPSMNKSVFLSPAFYIFVPALRERYFFRNTNTAHFDYMGKGSCKVSCEKITSTWSAFTQRERDSVARRKRKTKSSKGSCKTRAHHLMKLCCRANCSSVMYICMFFHSLSLFFSCMPRIRLIEMAQIQTWTQTHKHKHIHRMEKG